MVPVFNACLGQVDRPCNLPTRTAIHHQMFALSSLTWRKFWFRTGWAGCNETDFMVVATIYGPYLL